MLEDTLIIDIEASGLDNDSYPIEIAIGNCDQVNSWLIKPLPTWKYWNENAEEIHGISREYLEENGKSALEVANQIYSFLENKNGLLYSDASRWDALWIDRLFLDTATTKNYHILPIDDLVEYFDPYLFDQRKTQISYSDSIPLHRAANDVRIISKALKEFMD